MTRLLHTPTGLSGEASLLLAMNAIAPDGVRVGCRTIREGDETHLLPEEARSIPARHLEMRRASGAARLVARGLLATFGLNNFAVLRAPSGAPIWPEGFTGSLAHDDEMAVAAVAPVSRIISLGIDVEPAEPLPDDISALVTIDADVADTAIDRRLVGRLLFSAKEAVYKAVYPLDREVLGFEDIAIDLATGHATTRTGRRARLGYCVTPRVVVLALISN